MKLDKLTDKESSNINIVGFVVILLVVFMFAALLLSYYTKSTKHLNKIIYTLAGLYMAVVIAGAILYFTYRRNKADINAETDMIFTPLITIIIGFLVVTLVLYLKHELIEHLQKDLIVSTTVIGQSSGYNLGETPSNTQENPPRYGQ